MKFKDLAPGRRFRYAGGFVLAPAVIEALGTLLKIRTISRPSQSTVTADLNAVAENIWQATYVNDNTEVVITGVEDDD